MNLKLSYPLKTFLKHPPNFKVKILLFKFNTLGFHCGSAGKESTCNEGDPGSVPGLGRSLGEGKGSPLQYSVLENSMNCIVHGVAKSQIPLSDFHLLTRASLIAQLVKNLLAMWETLV